jgi:hypothetical protein
LWTLLPKWHNINQLNYLGGARQPRRFFMPPNVKAASHSVQSAFMDFAIDRMLAT